MTEPTMHTYADGSREWTANGKRHRTDGPAVEYGDGGRQWWVHGKRHRTDGPAIERSSGRRAWWVNDRDITAFVQPYLDQGMTDADAITAALIDIEREGGL